MSKLTPSIMDYINTVQALSIRKIEQQILEKFDIKISRETIRKYKNSLNDYIIVSDNQKSVKKVVRKNNGKTKKTKEIIEKVESFTMVVSCLHVNAHKLQKAQIEEIVGSSDVVSVRKFLLEEFKEALTN